MRKDQKEQFFSIKTRHATKISYIPLRGGLSALILALKQQPMKTELAEEQRSKATTAKERKGTKQVEVAKVEEFNEV